MINDKCIEKVDGMVIRDDGTTLETLELEKGWYRFSTESRDIYRCPVPKNCLGGVIETSKVEDKSLCKPGAEGPLCAHCDGLHFLSYTDGGCKECKGQNAWLGPLLCFVAVFAVGSGLFYYKSEIQVFVKKPPAWVYKLLQKGLLFILFLVRFRAWFRSFM